MGVFVVILAVLGAVWLAVTAAVLVSLAALALRDRFARERAVRAAAGELEAELSRELGGTDGGR